MKRGLRVAMMGHKRIPGREGGIEVVVEELATRMAARGIDVTAYNRWELFRRDKQTRDKVYKGVKIKQTPTIPLGGLNAFMYSALSTLRIAFSRYDVLHFHAIGCSSHVWLPHLLGKKVVVTIHGLDWQRAKWNRLATRYIIHGEHNTVRYADEIIVLSKGNQDYFMRRYGRQTTLIPNGYTAHEAPEAQIITEKYGLTKGSYILFITRIVPEKGLHYLLDAFSQVETDKKLIIAGPMACSEEYERELRADAAKDERVQFVGFVKDRELAELYGNCSVYVLPSDIEGMPMTVLEAISYGARVLTSDIEENVDAAKGCSFTFHKGDVTDLRAKLQDLCSHPETRVAGNGTEWEDWEQVTDRTLGVYRSLLDGKVKHRQRDVRHGIHARAKSEKALDRQL